MKKAILFLAVILFFFSCDQQKKLTGNVDSVEVDPKLPVSKMNEIAPQYRDQIPENRTTQGAQPVQILARDGKVFLRQTTVAEIEADTLQIDQRIQLINNEKKELFTRQQALTQEQTELEQLRFNIKSKIIQIENE